LTIPLRHCPFCGTQEPSNHPFVPYLCSNRYTKVTLSVIALSGSLWTVRRRRQRRGAEGDAVRRREPGTGCDVRLLPDRDPVRSFKSCWWRTHGATKSVAEPERRRADDGLRPSEGLAGRRAQTDRPDRHQGRLRHGCLRRLQRDPRRRAHALVHQEDAQRARLRRGAHHRGHRYAQPPASAAAGVDHLRGRSVRLLLAGLHRLGLRAPAEGPGPHAGPGAELVHRQPQRLPLLRLEAPDRLRHARRRRHARRQDHGRHHLQDAGRRPHLRHGRPASQRDRQGVRRRRLRRRHRAWPSSSLA